MVYNGKKKPHKLKKSIAGKIMTKRKIIAKKMRIRNTGISFQWNPAFWNSQRKRKIFPNN